ncbi:hypothetical protein F5Y05DRAFT_410610 [Hypoxylon sp. FL0543]|nr:hypothetical protein F5Y05DRAFT_410610 [Hypoxylon sp. FL0543]
MSLKVNNRHPARPEFMTISGRGERSSSTVSAPWNEARATGQTLRKRTIDRPICTGRSILEERRDECEATYKRRFTGSVAAQVIAYVVGYK